MSREFRPRPLRRILRRGARPGWSYRQQLAKIGVAADAAVSFRAFASRPDSLRQAMRSMDAPGSGEWAQVTDIFRDDYWTDEIQGVAWNGSHWLFSANANQAKVGTEDKSLYVFAAGASLCDDGWVTRVKYKDVPHPVDAEVDEGDDHWGQITYHQGRLYVSHWWKGGPLEGRASVVVFHSEGAALTFERWITLENPTSPTDDRCEKAEFQALNPWDGLFYTCFGGGTIHELFMHDPVSGAFTGEVLPLGKPMTGIQGACFSPNGHLYVSSNATLPGDERYQTIEYYSALNGHHFGTIAVLAQEGMPMQELEGICFGDVAVSGGGRAQLHAILLENPESEAALDNIFFKSFVAGRPERV